MDTFELDRLINKITEDVDFCSREDEEQSRNGLKEILINNPIQAEKFISQRKAIKVINGVLLGLSIISFFTSEIGPGIAFLIIWALYAYFSMRNFLKEFGKWIVKEAEKQKKVNQQELEQSFNEIIKKGLNQRKNAE